MKILKKLIGPTRILNDRCLLNFMDDMFNIFDEEEDVSQFVKGDEERSFRSNAAFTGIYVPSTDCVILLELDDGNEMVKWTKYFTLS